MIKESFQVGVKAFVWRNDPLWNAVTKFCISYSSNSSYEPFKLNLNAIGNLAAKAKVSMEKLRLIRKSKWRGYKGGMPCS